MFLKLSVALLFCLALIFVFQEAQADDCFFKACIPLITDCGWLKECKVDGLKSCCQISLGK